MRQPPLMLRRARAANPFAPEVHRSFAPIAGAWNELADRMAAPPFLRPGWFAAWWAAFGRGSLEILVLRDRSGAAAGVLPLARRAGTLRSLSNWHTPAFAPLVEPGAEQALVALLLACAVRRITLAFVDPRSRFVAECTNAGAASGHRSLLRVLERSPFLPLEDGWEEFERARFSGRHRSLLRRRRRQLMGAGGLAIEVSDGSDALDRRLAEGFAVEALSWKGEAGTAIASRPETRRFYTDVAHWAASRGDLRLAFLRVGGEAVAFDLALEGGGAHYLLKTGYDPGYARLGPGAVLRTEMVARAFAHGLDSYEFLGQDAPWKRDWTDHCHDRAVLQLFSSRPAGKVEWAAWAHAVPAARRAVALARR